ncbi:hypothetical protein TSAR_006338 [Trichomalopsis sarcophagae]|uniref:Secreted protein n=1 Tax=Trichomalopsis sarcophagae TaxID=543379 RepID=A0A232FJS8_9HYME|nr:hypothetical protein TSAR_006338 [Trichomalopsis sarcophagae]
MTMKIRGTLYLPIRLFLLQLFSDHRCALRDKPDAVIRAVYVYTPHPTVCISESPIRTRIRMSPKMYIYI